MTDILLTVALNTIPLTLHVPSFSQNPEFLSIILCACPNARHKFPSLSVVIVFVFPLKYGITLQDLISDVYSPLQDFGQVWSNAHGSHQYMRLVTKYCDGDSTGGSEVDTEKYNRRQLVKKQ